MRNGKSTHGIEPSYWGLFLLISAVLISSQAFAEDNEAKWWPCSAYNTPKFLVKDYSDALMEMEIGKSHAVYRTIGIKNGGGYIINSVKLTNSCAYLAEESEEMQAFRELTESQPDAGDTEAWQQWALEYNAFLWQLVEDKGVQKSKTFLKDIGAGEGFIFVTLDSVTGWECASEVTFDISAGVTETHSLHRDTYAVKIYGTTLDPGLSQYTEAQCQ